MENQEIEPIYAIGLDRVLTKSQIQNPFAIGPICFALPSGLYTQENPLNQVLLEFKNPRFNAIIDTFEILGDGFKMWSKVGLQVRKNGGINPEVDKLPQGDFFIPNIMKAVKFYGGIFNWVNPSPVWTKVVGFDITVKNGDILRSFIYNESGTVGYIWIKFFGHYEFAEKGDAI